MIDRYESDGAAFIVIEGLRRICSATDESLIVD